MASDRADHGHARRTRNGQRAAYPATRYIDPHRDQSRIGSRPEMSCAKVQKERLPLASRVSNVKLYTR